LLYKSRTCFADYYHEVLFRSKKTKIVDVVVVIWYWAKGVDEGEGRVGK
jgi:hypothetical protein